MTQGIEKIHDSVGHLVITDEGAILSSGGDLENDERSAAVIVSIVKSVTQLPFSYDKNIPFKTLTENVLPAGYSGSASRDLKYIKRLLTSRPGNEVTQEWPWSETKMAAQSCAAKRLKWRREKMPKISVIITFGNAEKISFLTHTIHSIIQRTPANLLTEILLIDDATTKEDFKETLEFYIRAIFNRKVKIIRSQNPLGLIRARQLGIDRAGSDVIAVMDSHMEVQPYWLEPLLHEINENPKTLAHSFLDWMEFKQGKWHYKHGGANWKTYFDWAMVFGYQMLGPIETARLSRDPTLPIASPVILGGAFVMRKSFFKHIGGYDLGMIYWGGENLDLAVRTWLFGGRVIKTTCSRIGHLEYAGSRDYRSKWTPEIHRNYKRFAEVWMDEYKKYFYDYFPHMVNVSVGDLSDRKALKKHAKHDFGWLLSNTLPELGLPDRDGRAWGGVSNLGAKVCLDTLGSNVIKLAVCHYGNTQMFFWSIKGELRFPIHVFNPYPNDAKTTDYVLRMDEYISVYNTSSPHHWRHLADGEIRSETSDLCLTVIPKTENFELDLKTCNGSQFQKWLFRFYK